MSGFYTGDKIMASSAGVAAAVLLSVAPAYAGVTLEQPKLKNVLFSSFFPAGLSFAIYVGFYDIVLHFLLG
jgi:hypothetical protein